MAYQGKSLQCPGRGDTLILGARDRGYLASKGYHSEPGSGNPFHGNDCYRAMSR